MPEENNTQPVQQEAGKTYTAEEMQAELNRVGAKEAGKAKAALLRKLNLASEDDIPGLLEKLNAQQDKPTEPQEPAKQPDNSEEYKKLLERMEALETTSNEAQAALAERQQLDYLREAKIPENQLDFYQFKIGKLVNEETTFEAAAAQYIKDNPPQIKPPEFATGSGKPMATATEIEKFKADYEAAVKNKNHAEMSRVIRLAQAKGVSVN